MELKTFFLILHIFGVAIGAGAAYLSDILFLTGIRDRKITGDEMKNLKIASHTVWFGLGLLIISGIGIFASNPIGYLSSAKFLAKMTIVLILIINGFLFQVVHLRNFTRSIGKDFFKSLAGGRSGHYVYLSGVVSLVSWTSAIILGALHSVTLSYAGIIFIYLFLIVLGVIVAFTIVNPVLKRQERRTLFWGGIVVPLVIMAVIASTI
jgi:hypothetical protein